MKFASRSLSSNRERKRRCGSFAAPLDLFRSHDTALRADRANLRLDFFVYSAGFSFCRASIDPSRDCRKNFRRALAFESPHVAHVGRLELLGESRQHSAPIDPAAWVRC